MLLARMRWIKERRVVLMLLNLFRRSFFYPFVNIKLVKSQFLTTQIFLESLCLYTVPSFESHVNGSPDKENH